jgi:hypothetical protein
MMRAPVRPLSGRWPAALERRLGRFFWQDPSIVLSGDASPDAFRAAMSAFYVGDTIKITGRNRHPAADDLLIENVDVRDAVIVDVGASDGSTSLDLIERLQGFRTFVIADLFLRADAVRTGRRTVIHDSGGRPVLVVGARVVAWPDQSAWVRRLYRRTLARAAAAEAAERTSLLLLNPAVRARMARDTRVTYAVHDVFTTWPGPAPDIMKVANVLRRLYFDDDAIRRGLTAVLGSLAEGGHLLLVDNPRIKGMGPRAGLYRREGSRFRTVVETPNAPEVADLVAEVSLAKVPAAAAVD